MRILLSILLVLCSISSVFAGDKLSDGAIKKKLLGYWESPRHAYLIKSDGIMYMCPRKFATTTDKWDGGGNKGDRNVFDAHFSSRKHSCPLYPCFSMIYAAQSNACYPLRNDSCL